MDDLAYIVGAVVKMAAEILNPKQLVGANNQPLAGHSSGPSGSITSHSTTTTSTHPGHSETTSDSDEESLL